MKNPPKIKKVPVRKCLGCGNGYPKKELIRIVRSPEGEVSLDFVGKKSGRGAYICKKSECLNIAVKSKRLSRNLETEIPDEIYKKLSDEISEYQKMSHLTNNDET